MDIELKQYKRGVSMPEAGRIRVALIADTYGEIDAHVLEEVALCDYVVHAG